MKTAEVFCKNYAIEKKFVAFVVDCNNWKAAEVYKSKYEIGKQRHTTEESCAIEKKAHMKKSTTVYANVVADVEKAS